MCAARLQSRSCPSCVLPAPTHLRPAMASPKSGKGRQVSPTSSNHVPHPTLAQRFRCGQQWSFVATRTRQRTSSTRVARSSSGSSGQGTTHFVSNLKVSPWPALPHSSRRRPTFHPPARPQPCPASHAIRCTGRAPHSYRSAEWLEGRKKGNDKKKQKTPRLTVRPSPRVSPVPARANAPSAAGLPPGVALSARPDLRAPAARAPFVAEAIGGGDS